MTALALALALAALIACALVGLGAVIGWALHADRQRRIARPVTPNAAHARRLP